MKVPSLNASLNPFFRPSLTLCLCCIRGGISKNVLIFSVFNS